MFQNNNRKNGELFEREFAQALFEKKFWVHKTQQSVIGQPADIIAVRNGYAYLIDCKDVQSATFPFKRIEDNQHSAMNLWKDRGNGDALFAFKIDDKVFLLTYDFLKGMSESNRTAIKKSEIELFGIPLERWLKKCP